MRNTLLLIVSLLTAFQAVDAHKTKDTKLNINNVYMQKCLLEEIQKGHIQCVDGLIDNGLKVNFRLNTTGQTPLHFAAEYQHSHIAQRLIDAGAFLDKQTKTYYYTPLHYAALKGSVEIVNLLVQAGASIEKKSKHGTPCQVANYIYHQLIKRKKQLVEESDEEQECTSEIKRYRKTINYLLRQSAEQQ